MHIKKIHILGSELSFDFSINDTKVRRWSMIVEPDKERQNLLFRLVAICLGGEIRIGAVRSLPGMDGVALILQSEPDLSNLYQRRYCVELTATASSNGIISAPTPYRIPWSGFYRRFYGFHDLTKPLGDFAYAVVPSIQKENVFEDLDPDFTPRARHTRFDSLLQDIFSWTSPNAWLHKQYRRVRYNSSRGQVLYNVALTAMSKMLPEVVFSHWDCQGIAHVQFEKKIIPLMSLPSHLLYMVSWIFDLVRQLADSRRFDSDFRFAPGILLFPHHEKLLQTAGSRVDINSFANLFPSLQFIVGCNDDTIVNDLDKCKIESVPGSNKSQIHQWITTKKSSSKEAWKTRNNFMKNRFIGTEPAKPDDVVLVDVDSTIPNLALMKLSHFFKDRGRRIILCRDSIKHRHAQQVFASTVFYSSQSQKSITRLQKLHGDSLTIGGTGTDLTVLLPPEVETLTPDYTLYPNMDYAQGFLTRGCEKRCKFCLVPQKEGSQRVVAELDDLVPKGFDKLVLLDNDFLGHSQASRWLVEISQRGLQVNFNQCLDIRQVTPMNAPLLEAVKSRNFSFSQRVYFFSMNNAALIPTVISRLALLPGIKPSEIRFVCMYGYDTTLADDIQRFRFLSSRRLTPFVQCYRQLPGMPSPQINNFFDTDPAPLAKIYFSTNGRIFENYLKWVSDLYFETHGQVCMPLVDRIFRYNNRHQKNAYISRNMG